MMHGMLLLKLTDRMIRDMIQEAAAECHGSNFVPLVSSCQKLINFLE